MIDNFEEKAEKYIKRHLEPIGKEPIETPKILLNTNNQFRDLLISQGEVNTPYLTIKSIMSPFDATSFIEAYRTGLLADLEARETNLSDNEYMGNLGQITGAVVRLSILMENKDKDKEPVYKLNELVFETAKGRMDLAVLANLGIKVIWNPYQHKKWSAFDPDGQVVVVCGDITSLEGAYITAHEMKHVIDYAIDPQKITEYQKVMGVLLSPSEKDLEKVDPGIKEPWLNIIRSKASLTSTDMKLFLEYERNAHAFALRQMGTLIDNREILNALRDNIHQYSMQINSNILASKL